MVENADQIKVRSPLRVQPACEHFGTCGGCAMQHVNVATQIAAKQRMLEDNLWHLGKVIFNKTYWHTVPKGRV